LKPVSGLLSAFLLWFLRCCDGLLFQPVDEGLVRCPACHVPTLVGSFGVVADEPVIEDGLHFLDRLEPCPAAFDAEVLVKHGAVEALDDAVGLRAADLGRAVLDLLKLKEELVRMQVGPAAEFPSIVAEHRLDPGVMGLEGRDDVVVEDMNGGDRQLGRIEPGPGMARMAIDGRLHVDLADPLERTDKEGVDGDETSRMFRLNMTLAEFGREAFEQFDLLVGKADRPLGRLSLSNLSRRSCLVSRL
jgi:hypothetical protein